MFTATWYLHDEPIDSVEFEDDHDNLLSAMHGRFMFSHAYLCPACGEIWSRYIITATEEENREFRWAARSAECPSCAPPDGGLLLDNYYAYGEPVPFRVLATYHPIEMLNREARILQHLHSNGDKQWLTDELCQQIGVLI